MAFGSRSWLEAQDLLVDPEGAVEIVNRNVDARETRLALAVFFQMLPATIVSPATRPLFAYLHAGSEGAMHASGYRAGFALAGGSVLVWLVLAVPALRRRGG